MKALAYKQRRLKLMASHVVGQRVLDIGYADTPNPFLADKYCVGYDLVEVPVGRTTYQRQVVGDVAEITEKLCGETFDTILCGELIEHLENPYAFLRSLHPLLNPTGRLVLSTPNPAGFPAFVAELLQLKRMYYTKEHTYYFLPRWVKRLLDRSGFSLLKSQGVGLWLPFGPLPFCPQILSYQLIYVAQPNPSSRA